MNGGHNFDPAWLRQQFPDLANVVPLSSGGQKFVFSATHNRDGDVVLKLLHPNNDVETIRREILAVSQMGAVFVPRILDTGVVPSQTGNWFWFREQRINGRTIREHLAAGPLTPTQVLRLGRDVLGSLQAAENARIVHRDVKPENVILDGSGQHWLIDFGIARHLNLQSNTATVAAFGKFTLGYAPPEQTRNIKADIDTRCDLFALGVTLFECATAKQPFRDGARDHLEILSRVETLPLPRLSLKLADATGFADLLASMTQKRRDHRPHTIAEALDWMKEICDSEGI